MLSLFNTRIVAAVVCWILALLAAYLHGAGVSLVTMGIASFMVLLISLIQAFIFISYSKPGYQPSESLISKKSFSYVWVIVLTVGIVTFNTDMSLFKTISSSFTDPNIYSYRTFINSNLIYVFCGFILLNWIVSSKLLIKSKASSLWIVLSIFIFILSLIPKFYQLNVATTGLWALLAYSLFSDVTKQIKAKAHYLTEIISLVSIVSLGVLIGFYFSTNWLIISLSVIAGALLGDFLNQTIDENSTNQVFLSYSVLGVIGLITLGYLTSVSGLEIPKMVIALLSFAVLVLGVLYSRRA